MEPDPWRSAEETVRGSDVVIAGEVVAVGPVDAGDDRVTDRSSVPYEATVRVTDALTTTARVAVGDTVRVGNGAVSGAVPDEPCLLLSIGDTVVVGLLDRPAVERFVLFNVDSVFYVDGEDVRDTGRGYGGFPELEAMTPEALRERLVSAGG